MSRAGVRRELLVAPGSRGWKSSGDARPARRHGPGRWVPEHLLPRGVNRLGAAGSRFPRAPLGGEQP